MQTHLLNVTINWPRSVIFVCHSTLFTLTAINVSLKTSGRSSVTQQYCHTIHTFLSVFTSFTGDKRLFDLRFFLNSPAVNSWSDFFMDWIPLRAHECRRQCEFTSACHKTLYSWSFCTGFIKLQEAPVKSLEPLKNGRNEGDAIVFCGIVRPQVFSSSPRCSVARGTLWKVITW